MRILLTCIILCCSGSLFAQLDTRVMWTEQTSLPSSEVIYFRAEKPLQWKDFKGKPDMNSRAAAVTMSGFGYKAEIKNIGNTGQLNISVYCYFSKPKSWVKEGKNTDYILNHEQHHFNISYMAACIFMDKIRSVNFTVANVNTLLPKLYTEACNLMNKLQDDYDGQTRNGQLKDVQEKWNNQLTEKLAALTR